MRISSVGFASRKRAGRSSVRPAALQGLFLSKFFLLGNPSTSFLAWKPTSTRWALQMTCKGEANTTMTDLTPQPRRERQIGRSVILKQSPIDRLRSSANSKSKRKNPIKNIKRLNKKSIPFKNLPYSKLELIFSFRINKPNRIQSPLAFLSFFFETIYEV